MFYIIGCFSGWLFNIGSFCSQGGLRLKSHKWNIIRKTIRPSQWQIRNLVECAIARHIRCKSVQIHLPPCVS